MLTEKYTLTDPMGLHARIATEIAKTVHQCKSHITVHFNNIESDARDVIGLMALDIREGETLTVTIDGSDETKASASLKETLAPYC
ncbi:HPr family phosphocarrier protein [Lancefieldella rimae]|uniref:HPr family phosphocarrier protein n=1 Tax=Lancefieldella rimae TaxID=1383 RepID=UPI001CB2CEAC|nr:HPr family phosphocarrier protein [Lancefieldella rimae]MBF4803660.1 HPr family phosphocarrier protein [Lancefieldella rimae]